MPPVKEELKLGEESGCCDNKCETKLIDGSLSSPTDMSIDQCFMFTNKNGKSSSIYFGTLKPTQEKLNGLNGKINAMCNCNISRTKKNFPIAIIGLGCRMPGGVKSPEDFWKVISEGRNVISEVPPDRWDIEAYYNTDSSKPNTMVTRKAGFVDNIDQFDHSFFKISPREAAMMDPQQRLLLEVTHEAFEDAGILPEKLKDKCGVFVGIGMIDYSIMLVHEKDNINQYLHTGVAHSVAANRISYAFNLKGPSLAIDTACAASMTSMHVACNSLWNGDCEIGVVSGCNILALPEITCGFSAMGVLSPDGECRPFDEDAKGYVRSEGWGVCIIKPLELAIKDGDHIYSVIKGSAIGDNGYSSSLTMPSKDDQVHLMRKVYSKFNVPVQNVSYVEAHGTGTPVGDPIEAHAIGNVFGHNRNEPLKIGSVKSNFGHMELAAGMASMIKSCLMLDKRMLVPSIHFDKPSSKIDMEKLNITVQTKLEPFSNKCPITIGINCFGFGGALAHMILEEYSYPDKKEFGEKCGWKFGSNYEGNNILIPLSAKSNQGLIDLCRKWQSFTHENDALGIVGWQSTRRTHFPQRLAIIANSGAKFVENLNLFSQGSSTEEIITGSVNTEEPKICMVFPGQGQQWADMGRNLYTKEEVFKKVIDTCDDVFKKISGWSLLKDYHIFHKDFSEPNEDPEASINKIEITQPAITFFQIALYELWKHWGIKPSVIIGHSLGEVTAAYVAGGLTLVEAVQVIYIRSHEQAKLANSGSMAAVRMSEEEAINLCSQHEDLYIACINSISSVTIAGKTETIQNLEEMFPTKVKQLRVQCAFHTPHMDVIKDSFLKKMYNVVSTKSYSSAIPCYSTVTGGLFQNTYDGQYWWKNIRFPVNFLSSIQAILRNHSIDIFLEVGAAATLLSCVSQIAQGQKLSYITSCQRQRNDHINVLNALGRLYVSGVNVNWDTITKATSTWSPIPTYAWQHQSHWNESEVFRLRRLGLEDKSFKGQNGKISLKNFPYLADHVIQNRTIFPASGYIEYMIETVFNESSNPILNDIMLMKVLPLSNEKDEAVHLIAKINSSQIYLQHDDNLHSQAKIGNATSKEQSVINIENILTQCTTEVSSKDFYKYFSSLELNYGENFQMVEKVFIGDWKAVGYLKPSTDRYQRVNVAALDSAFQIALFALGYGTTTYLPIYISQLDMNIPSLPLNEQIIVFAQITDCDAMNVVGDIMLLSSSGSVILKVSGFKAQNISGTKSSVNLEKCLYQTIWQPLTSCLPSTDLAKNIFSEEYLDKEFFEDYINIKKAEEVLEELKEIAASYAKFSLEIVPKSEIHPRNHAYVKRLEAITSEYKCEYPLDTLEERLQKIECQCPEFSLEISMVKRLGNILTSTLQDPSVALQILFAGDCLAQYFIDSLSTRIYYKAGSEIIRQAVEEAAKHKKIIRILEIGGRMGGLAKHILKSLQGFIDQDRIQYVFTDLNVTFFLHAQQTLSEYPIVKYQQLDFEKDVASQDFIPGTFDIVVCMDTIHSAVDINNGIKNMRDLLCEDGWLMLYEATNASPMCEIIFGSLELCWVFNDERKDVCWLSKEGWAQSLEHNGFKEVVSITTPNEFFHSITIGSKMCDIPKRITEELVIIASPNSNDLTLSISKKLCGPTLQLNPYDIESFSGLLEARSNKCSIIYLWEEKDTNLQKLLVFFKHICMYTNAVHKIWIITEDGNVECESPVHALAIGFARVASNELNNLPVIAIDLPGNADIEVKSQYLINAINYQCPDRELAIRNGNILVPRLHRCPEILVNNISKGKWRLELNKNVTKTCLDDINFYQLPEESLGHGSVKIKVKAAALNFKDIMMGMGLLEGLNLGQSLGLECSGIVSAVGVDVKNIKVGDAVIALGENCFAEEVICDSHFIVKKPKEMTFTDAAGFPMTFITAYHALIERAALQYNETVLIHSACGGVGLAAIQIAKMVGAKIICSVGTSEKKEFLQTVLEIEHVTDSHSLSFYDDVLKFTNGHGVDVVLNSLSGQFLVKSMDLLAPGGRFCEIGKRDILENTDLKILGCFLENKSLLSVQIDLLMSQNPNKIHYLLNQVTQLYIEKHISPLPTRINLIEDYLSTFRSMSSGQHIGKVVMEIPTGFTPQNLKPTSKLFKSNAIYLITGGFGGIGINIVRWMAKKGARHICLLSRGGCKSEASKATMNYLKNLGVLIYSFVVDVSDRKSLEQSLITMRNNSGLPLKGIFHLAAVFEDASIPNLTKEQLDHSLNAKFKGALFLDELTKEDNLDFFIMMSSVNSAFGNPEQVNYVSANAYLDALAINRRCHKLAGISIQMGAVRGAGYIDDKPDVAKITESKGLMTLHINECLEALEVFISRPEVPPVICLANMDWNRTVSFVHPTFMKFRHLLQENTLNTGCSEVTSEDLNNKVTQKLSDLLFISMDQIESNKPMIDYGVDSLMAVELVNWLNKEFKLHISQLDILGGMTTDVLLSKALDGEVVLPLKQ